MLEERYFLSFTSLLKAVERRERRKGAGCLLVSFTQAQNIVSPTNLVMTERKETTKAVLSRSSVKILKQKLEDHHFA